MTRRPHLIRGSRDLQRSSRQTTAATACPGHRSPSEGYECIEVCIASWVSCEMMGLWFGSPKPLGHPIGWYATRRRLGGGTLGCVPIPTAPGSRNNSAVSACGIRRSGSPLLYSPECVEGEFLELCLYLILRSSPVRGTGRGAAQEEGREVSPDPRHLILKGLL